MQKKMRDHDDEKKDSHYLKAGLWSNFRGGPFGRFFLFIIIYIYNIWKIKTFIIKVIAFNIYYEETVFAISCALKSKIQH